MMVMKVLIMLRDENVEVISSPSPALYSSQEGAEPLERDAPMTSLTQYMYIIRSDDRELT